MALIDAASIPGTKEIWVAGGTYAPTEQLGSDPTTRTFVMREETSLFGGFAGSELLREQRNPLLYETVLDGEIQLPRPPSCDSPAPGADDCFTVTPDIPTCTEAECCGVVCNVSPPCCETEWDTFCVDLAGVFCTSNNPETIRVTTVVRAVGVDNDSQINGFTVTRGASSGGSGAGVLVGNGTFRMVRCLVIDNEADEGAGAIFTITGDETAEVLNCRFESNTATAGGAGLSFRGRLLVANSVFIGNVSGGVGGGVRDTSSTSTVPRQVINCTFTGNIGSSGGGLEATTGLDVRNCIVWGNETSVGGVSEIGGSPTVNFSAIRNGWSGPGGTGNVVTDPLFAAPSNGNVRLLSGSPCIDAGDGTESTTQLVQDVDDIDEDGDTSERLPDGDLNPRVVNGDVLDCLLTIDMGAYEFDPCPSDFGGDGLVDGGDLGVLLAAWGPCQACAEDINSDGLVDGGDLGVLLAAWGPCDDGCGSESMQESLFTEQSSQLSPSEAAEILGFSSVAELAEWLSELDFEDMATLLLELFGV